MTKLITDRIVDYMFIGVSGALAIGAVLYTLLLIAAVLKTTWNRWFGGK